MPVNTLNGGDFRQVGVPADDPVCDLIYALGNATIEINGGTFKAGTFDAFGAILCISSDDTGQDGRTCNDGSGTPVCGF